MTADDTPSRPSDSDTEERRESLWWLAASPTIWALHFLGSYITVAVRCAKGSVLYGSLGWARGAIYIYTGVALLGVAAIGVRAYRRHTIGNATVPHDFDTRADRTRFLGFATLLLSALSAVAIVYVMLPTLYLETCR